MRCNAVLIHRLYMGASSALNVAAAEMMAKELGPGNNIVTILCGKICHYSRLTGRWCVSIPDKAVQ